MLLRTIKNSYQSLLNQRQYSAINILGLSISLAAVLLIFLWVHTELSFDRFHDNYENLYRVNKLSKSPNRTLNMGRINAPAGPEFSRMFASIEKAARIRSADVNIKYGDRFFPVSMSFTDSTFFDILSFELISGNRETCLDASNRIVLSESLATRIFGNKQALGESVMLGEELLTVSAIAKDPPLNSSISFGCLARFEHIEKISYIGWDGGLSCLTLVRLTPGTSVSDLEAKMMNYIDEKYNYRARPKGFEMTPYLQEFSMMHLHSDTDYDALSTGSIARVISFSMVGLLILLAACFNFVNINTALSIKRSREVSIKKIYGSGRGRVIIGFISESGLAIIISLLLATIMLSFLLPSFNKLIGINLNTATVAIWEWVITYIILFILCTLLASFYGAWYISAVEPMTLIRETFTGKKKQLSRNILVTVQFIISTSLIICTLVFFTQMRFLNNADLGFKKENIVTVPLSKERSDKAEIIKEKLKSIPGINSVTKSAGGFPGLGLTSNGYNVEDFDEMVLSNCVYTDNDYTKTFGISIKDGRDFRDEESDRYNVLVNETFVKHCGWDNPIGKIIERNWKEYTVIGVVKDFSTSSLHTRIQPLIISQYNEWGDYEHFIFKTEGISLKNIEKELEAIFIDADPGEPFTFNILEDSLASLYTKEKYINILFLLLAIVGIVVSCLGLFGLATFSMQVRKKEIGVRKVSGAVSGQIISKFSSELLLWLIVAFAIAAPLSYIIMDNWLTNFEYRITISLWLLLGSGAIVLTIGFLSIAWALVKQSSRTPADLLRFE